MKNPARVFRDIFTGRDNKTHDIGKWSWAICIAAVIAHDGYLLYHKTVVDVLSFAAALGAVCAAHGIAIGAKKATDHDISPQLPVPPLPPQSPQP